MPLKTLCLVALFLMAMPFSAPAEERRGYHLTLYGAMLTDGGLPETAVLTADIEGNDHFVALAIGKTVGNWKDWIDFELEGQVVRHLKGQHHWEFNGLIVARWLRFPWNETLRTSLAVGEGLSLASETPDFEDRFHHEKTNPLLNYLMLELAFSRPADSRWSLVARVHHRSGIYGLFNGVHGASNAVGLGIRYHF